MLVVFDNGTPRTLARFLIDQHTVTEARSRGWAELENGELLNKAEVSTTTPAYFEIIDFIAAGTTPEEVGNFRPSLESQQRVAELIEREKGTGLSTEERAELDHFMELEHILRMAKARARQILARGQCR